MQTNILAGDPVVSASVSTSATNVSAASWGAILAGAAAAAALSLVLIILGTGLGFATTSPWSDRGLEASTVGISSIVWIVATQLAASALGGYLAGRLRVKWPDVQTDEIFFRDTAHGLLTWAVATLFTAAFLGAALTTAVGAGVQAGAAAAGSAGAVAAQAATTAAATSAAATNAAPAGKGGAFGAGLDDKLLDYFVGGMFRSEQSASAQPPDQAQTPGNPTQSPNQPQPTGQTQPAADTRAAVAEASTVLAYSLRTGQFSAEDKARLGQLVARRTGVSQADAEKRVTEIYYRASTELANAEAAAKEAADKARKVAAHVSLWLFVALLGGAFCASYAATIGGRQRDY